MFAKVFGQIFDSSIAEDYNCRRMFMDLLVLADSDGVVDMTQEAISRRTNVPIEQVCKYIDQLQQPDTQSRSKEEQGRRIIPIDVERGWGWQIVNYRHYRQIRDEEARRSYFRAAKQKQRKGNKRKVKDIMVDTGGGCQIVPSASSSKSASSCTQKEVEDFCESLALPRSDGEAMFLHWQEKGPAKVKDWKATIRKWKSFGYLPSQKNGSAGSKTFPAKPRTMSFDERKRKIGKLRSDRNDLFRLKQEEHREFTEDEAEEYRKLTQELKTLEAE